MNVSTFAYCNVFTLVYNAPKNAIATNMNGFTFSATSGSDSTTPPSCMALIATADVSNWQNSTTDGAGKNVTATLFMINIMLEHDAYATIPKTIFAYVAAASFFSASL